MLEGVRPIVIQIHENKHRTFRYVGIRSDFHRRRVSIVLEFLGSPFSLPPLRLSLLHGFVLVETFVLRRDSLSPPYHFWTVVTQIWFKFGFFWPLDPISLGVGSVDSPTAIVVAPSSSDCGGMKGRWAPSVDMWIFHLPLATSTSGSMVLINATVNLGAIFLVVVYCLFFLFFYSDLLGPSYFCSVWLCIYVSDA